MDQQKTEKDERGLHSKYRVERVNDPDGKHEACWYFVLDLTHDPLGPLALGALRRYAHNARNAGYVTLAADLDHIVHQHSTPVSEEM